MVCVICWKYLIYDWDPCWFDCFMLLQIFQVQISCSITSQYVLLDLEVVTGKATEEHWTLSCSWNQVEMTLWHGALHCWKSTLEDESFVAMKKCTWSATIFKQAVACKWSLIGTNSPKVFQENIPQTITPPAASLDFWQKAGWVHGIMLLAPNSHTTICVW